MKRQNKGRWVRLIKKAVQKFLKLLFLPLAWAIVKFYKVDDEWEKHKVRHSRFFHMAALSNFKSFDEILSGNLSTDHIQSLDDVKQWLMSCEYDFETMGKPYDVLHPVQFEKIKKGKCSDFSLWTWRKLKELGYNCEYMSGWIDAESTHAWVMFEKDGNKYLFEPAAQDENEMIQEFDKVVIFYWPEHSFDSALNKFYYEGAIVTSICRAYNLYNPFFSIDKEERD